jgi:hypothetical protein
MGLNQQNAVAILACKRFRQEPQPPFDGQRLFGATRYREFSSHHRFRRACPGGEPLASTNVQINRVVREV